MHYGHRVALHTHIYINYTLYTYSLHWNWRGKISRSLLISRGVYTGACVCRTRLRRRRRRRQTVTANRPRGGGQRRFREIGVRKSPPRYTNIRLPIVLSYLITVDFLLLLLLFTVFAPAWLSGGGGAAEATTVRVTAERCVLSDALFRADFFSRARRSVSLKKTETRSRSSRFPHPPPPVYLLKWLRTLVLDSGRSHF